MKVVDASVVTKALLDEPGREEAKELLERGSGLVVPDILFVEVANALATKAVVSEEGIKEGLDFVYNMNFEVKDTTREVLTEAAGMAKKKGTAVYDMIYAILARKLKGELVTADGNFIKKSGFSWVKMLGS